MKSIEYQLTIRATPGHSWTPEQRLKQILKRLLRTYGFTCQRCQPAQATANDGEAPPEPTSQSSNIVSLDAANDTDATHVPTSIDITNDLTAQVKRGPLPSAKD